MQNSFNRDLLFYWFIDNHECWICKENRLDAFHHIVGRGFKGSKCEKSILNACPIHNNKCHLSQHGLLRKDENVKILLQKTIRYLLKKGYEFNELDKEFIMKYKEYYN